MIQRIQSIFLLLASLCFSALFFAPFAISNVETDPFFQDKLFDVKDHSVLLGLTILGIILCLVSIFLFKNRLLQKRLGIIAIICALFLGGVAAWLFYNNSSTMANNVIVEDQIGLYLPILMIIFLALSNYFITKDEKLVSSMDRLR